MNKDYPFLKLTALLLQEKGWDEFADFTRIPELSLISSLPRERLVFNDNVTFFSSVIVYSNSSWATL